MLNFFYYDLAHKADFIDKIESYIKLYIDAKLYHVTWHEKLQTIEKLTQNRFHNEYYRSKQGFLFPDCRTGVTKQSKDVDSETVWYY